jgi:hypothetical protein
MQSYRMSGHSSEARTAFRLARHYPQGPEKAVKPQSHPSPSFQTTSRVPISYRHSAKLEIEQNPSQRENSRYPIYFQYFTSKYHVFNILANIPLS